MAVLQSDCRNVLLRRMSADDFSRLSDSLQLVEMQHRDSLGRPGLLSDSVYFPETGVGSITSNREPMRIEIGLVGREGFIGIPVVLGDGAWPAASFVQIPGSFLKMPADVFRAATLASPSLQSLALRYVQAYIAQVSSTAIANASFNVEERLARWLLMASDRVDGFELALTHDFLAMMLGVRRPGVTVGTHVLEGEHAIRATRGKIQVVNRSKLVELAGASYGMAEAEYDRLIGRDVADTGQGVGVDDETALPTIGRPSLSASVPADLVGCSILVVEDDYDLARDTERALMRAGGTVFGPVGRETEALALLAKAPRCALVDINLGDGTRFEVAGALQDRGVPFVFVTGYGDDVIPARFADVPRLRKPVEFGEIVHTAAQLCAVDRRVPPPLARLAS